MLLFSIGAKAQWLLHNSLSPETQYPDAAMVPTAYNLDKAKTKYLTNFAYPAPAPFAPGSSLELAGWSTDIDGGFTFGESAPPVPPLFSSVYSGHGAISLPNVRDVQVGYLQNGTDNYIIAAYYDNAVQLYGYSLYAWDLIAQTATILYTSHFQDPNFIAIGYTPNTQCTPVSGGISYPYFPPPSLTSTMDYNRISMDINKDANKVIMVMTNDLNGFMYTTAGVVGPDTVILCPNLPPIQTEPYPCSNPPPPNILPIPEFDYFSGSYAYVLSTSTGDYDYYDIGTGIYVRYYASLGSPATYHYSYYPIDKGVYVTEFIRTSPTVTSFTQIYSPKPPSLYSPLIRIKSVSTVVSPCAGPYYISRYPDVAFGGDNLSYVFYAATLGDLYVNDHTYPTSFNDVYTYVGASISSFFCAGAGQTDMAITFKNTADGLFISSYGPGGAVPGLESSCVSINPLPPITYYDFEVWSHIDAPDLGGGDKWAVTFAHSPLWYVDYTITPHPTVIIHDYPEIGKNNIYVRSNYEQSILTNGSMGNVAINVRQNVSPSISFKPMSITNVSVAWASEDAGHVNGSNWGYIGAELNTTVPYSTTSLSSLVTLNDYLHLASNPSYDAGDHPLVSLSKHTDGLGYLYTAYTQEDAVGTYSLMNKNKPNSSTSFWKTSTIGTTTTQLPISVAPNPFSNSLHVSSSESLSVQVTDVLGRTMGSYKGTATEVNKQLDALAQLLNVGTYILKANGPSGSNEFFKLTKH